MLQRECCIHIAHFLRLDSRRFTQNFASTEVECLMFTGAYLFLKKMRFRHPPTHPAHQTAILLTTDECHPAVFEAGVCRTCFDQFPDGCPQSNLLAWVRRPRGQIWHWTFCKLHVLYTLLAYKYNSTNFIHKSRVYTSYKTMFCADTLHWTLMTH